MSAEKVIFNLLKNHTPLVAVVPATRIFAGEIPLNTALPSIAYSHVSTVENTAIGMTALLLRSRIQVTVAVAGTDTASYAKVKKIIGLIIDACNYRQGVFNSVDTKSVIRDAVSPDMRDDDSTTSFQSVDFIVTYTE